MANILGVRHPRFVGFARQLGAITLVAVSGLAGVSCAGSTGGGGGPSGDAGLGPTDAAEDGGSGGLPDGGPGPGDGGSPTDAGPLPPGGDGGPCVAPRVDCGGGVCADTTADSMHCGACGNACPAGFACVASACACATPGGCVVEPIELELGRYDGCNMLPDGTRRCIGFSFARMSDGSVRSWGGNTSGELADGTTTSRSMAAAVASLAGAAAIAPGNQHACARDAGGTVRCWGDATFGQTGLGVTTGRTDPGAIAGLAGVVQLVSGGYHSCALLADGTVQCWGMGQFGQLGATPGGSCLDGSYACATSPIGVAITGVAQLALGNAHSCALTTAGTVQCWGVGQYGQLGAWDTGDTCADPGREALPCRRTPAEVPGLTGVAEIGLGDAHTCARLTDGTVRCLGNGRLGQLGDGAMTSRAEPVTVVGLSGVTQIAVGSSHACALRTDGTVWCWGGGYLGNLGFMPSSRCVMDLLCQPTPAQIPGLTGVVHIATGGAHTCSIHDDGAVRCWGYNLSGQLGDGTTTGRGEPVLITIP